MGKWTEYFEDFPEEDPGNYVGDRFHPEGVEAFRAFEEWLESERPKMNARIVLAQAKFDAGIARTIKTHSPASA